MNRDSYCLVYCFDWWRCYLCMGSWLLEDLYKVHFIVKLGLLLIKAFGDVPNDWAGPSDFTYVFSNHTIKPLQAK